MQNSKDFHIKLVVNSKPVALNPFAHDIIRNVVCSLITSLKLENEPEKIELIVEKQFSEIT